MSASRCLRCLPALALAVAMLGGCAGGAVPGQSTSVAGQSGSESGGAGAGLLPDHFGRLALSFEEEPVIEKNQALWTLPTDAYSPQPMADLGQLAGDLVRTDCMRRSGFPDARLSRDYGAPLPATWGPYGARLFSVEIAQKYGYRPAPDPGDTSGGRGAVAGQSDEYLNAWDRCDLEALNVTDVWSQEKLRAEDRAVWERIHPGQPYPTGEAEAEAWFWERTQIEAQEAEAASKLPDPSSLNRWSVDTSGPELQAAAARWRDCMAPLGIVDLPAEPWGLATRPPDSLLERWSWDDTLGQPASADEVSVATQDAQCRQDSGWFDLLYQESWNQAEALVKQYGPELHDRYTVGYGEFADHYLAVIREYLPKVTG